MSNEAMKQALYALKANDELINGTKTHGGLVFAMDRYYSGSFDIDGTNKQTEQAINALRQAIEQAEEPWVKTYAGGKPNYTTPTWEAKREWVGLTDEEWIKELGVIREQISGDVFGSFYRAIEAKLREKNGATAPISE